MAPGGEVPQLTTGDSVRHSAFDEGVVTRVKPGVAVTVGFADGGLERRPVLEYARLERIA